MTGKRSVSKYRNRRTTKLLWAMSQRKYFRTKKKSNLDIDSYVMSNTTKLERFKGCVNMLTKTFIFTSVETYVSETYKCKLRKLTKKNEKHFSFSTELTVLSFFSVFFFCLRFF